jgi:hypothetical protein
VSSVETWRVFHVLLSMLETLDAGKEVGSEIPDGMPTSSSPNSSQLPLDFKDVSAFSGEIVPLMADIDWVSWHSL